MSCRRAGVGEQTQAICTFRRDRKSSRAIFLRCWGPLRARGMQRTLNAHLLTTVTWSRRQLVGERRPLQSDRRQSSQSPDPPGAWGGGCAGVGVWGCGLPLCGRQLRDPVLARSGWLTPGEAGQLRYGPASWSSRCLGCGGNYWGSPTSFPPHHCWEQHQQFWRLPFLPPDCASSDSVCLISRCRYGDRHVCSLGEKNKGAVRRAVGSDLSVSLRLRQPGCHLGLDPFLPGPFLFWVVGGCVSLFAAK